jgi:pimeloyl-ACP methyl ester carboxylesterase
MRAVAPLSRMVLAGRGVAPARADREFAVPLPGGRRLGVAEFRGEGGGVPVLYLHGFLGSRLEPGAIEGRTATILGVDRPCYGRTDAQEGEPSLAAFGRDVRDGLDALGVGRCVVVGASAGAPYALAAALALGPARAPRLVLAGGIGGPDVLGGAGGGAVTIVRLSGRGRFGRGRLLRRWFGLARRTGLDRALLGAAIGAESEALARHGLRASLVHERMLRSLREGSGPAMRGIAADARLLTRPWDVDPGALEAGALVVHGADDAVVPVAHARWWAARLPRARLEVLPGERHLSACFASVPTVERIAREVGEGAPLAPDLPPRDARPADREETR